jgi:biotin transport system substrate-specific component
MPARRSSSRDLALIASFAALVAVMGMPGSLSLFGNAVPVTLQTLGVMLAGSVLGWRRAFLALLVFLALVAAGLPLLAGGRGGLGVFAGPSAGFLLAFPFCAALIGWLVERGGPSYHLAWGVVANLLGGIVLMYAAGTLGMVALAHLRVGTAVAANAWYVVGDLAKVLVAALVARGVHAAYPGLLAERPRRVEERAAA